MVFDDYVEDIEVLEERLRETEALVLIRERTKIGAGSDLAVTVRSRRASLSVLDQHPQTK